MALHPDIAIIFIPINFLVLPATIHSQSVQKFGKLFFLPPFFLCGVVGLTLLTGPYEAAERGE